MFPTLVAVLFLAQCTGACDTAEVPAAIPAPFPDPAPDTRMGQIDPQPSTAQPSQQPRLMQRAYGLGGVAMRRGLVPFGDRVLVVGRPADDKTPQHVVAVTNQGVAEYLTASGDFAVLPTEPASAASPAILRGEGVEVDYADGVLALLNSDSLSDWTDSGFLDWGAGQQPSGSPDAWSTTVPLVRRESHQRTVAVLGPDAGASGTLMVAHVGRFFKDDNRTEPVTYPSAMVSTDRGRSWAWAPGLDASPPPGAYAAAWPDAPGGGRVLYFVVTRPSDSTPPLVAFVPDAAAKTGVRLDMPFETDRDLWGEHGFVYGGVLRAPQPRRHWVTDDGLYLDTAPEGLFWMATPTSKPVQVESVNPTTHAPDLTLYFAYEGAMMRVTPDGSLERLGDAASASWSRVGSVTRDADVIWTQAAAGNDGALWLLGHDGGDLTVATWPAGTAL